MSGILSLAITNVSSSKQHIQAIDGLPSKAVSIKWQSVWLISEIIPKIKQIQELVLSYADHAESQLNQVKNQLAGNTPLKLVQAQLKTLQRDSSKIKSYVDSLADKIVASANQVYGFTNPLAEIQLQLRSQKIVLQEQMSKARNEAASNKRYFYLFAVGTFGLATALVSLGTFGLAGLALPPVGLYLQWKSEADNLEAQVNAANLQISRLDIMMSRTNQLITDVRDLSSKIINLKNAIDFLSADIATIIDNIRQESGRTMINIYVKAALSQVLILNSDAS